MIPRILHQVWLGDAPFPREYERYQRSWTRLHPDWELRFWTEANLPGDLERKEVYERLRKPAERSDILRLEVLTRFGGVYVDTDFECLRSIEPLLEGVDFFCAYIDPGRVNNAIVGATPGHPLLRRALRELMPRESYGYDKEGTGPLFLDRLVGETPGVTIFAEELFYPRTDAAAAGAYAIHHAGRSWKEPAELVKDAQRAERRLALLQDELDRSEQRNRLALAELDALRKRSRGERTAGPRALALRLRRLAVRRIPVDRLRYVLGRARSRVLPR